MPRLSACGGETSQVHSCRVEQKERCGAGKSFWMVTKAVGVVQQLLCKVSLALKGPRID